MFEYALAAVAVLLLANSALAVRAELRRRSDLRAADRILARMEEQRAHREYMARPRCPGCGTRPGEVCWPHASECAYALVLDTARPMWDAEGRADR